MAIRRSTALINKLAQGYGVRELLRDGRIYLYSGAQPASADDAPSGTLLAIFTLAAGTYTAPTRSSAKFTIAGGSGSIDTVKVGGMDFNLLSSAVAYNVSTTQTASDVVSNINARQNPLNIVAVADSSDVQLHLPYWLGANGDNLSLAVTATTLTAQINGGSSTVFGGTGSPAAGVTAVNGLNFLESISSGALSKEATAWQASGITDGTAGWFRFVAGGSDATVVDSSYVYVRFDGSVATSGGDMTISSTAITGGAIYTISNGTITEPAA